MSETENNIVYETYKPGELIFQEGEMGYHFFIIEKGRVQIYSKNKNGSPVDIAIVESGESFGEFALLEKKPRSASAKALDECKVAKISPEGYEQLLSELPVWAVCMMKSFANRIKKSNDLLQEVSQFLLR